MEELDDPWDDYDGTCQECGGDGFIHDCGDDSCCCLDPDEDDCFFCEACGGSGVA